MASASDEPSVPADLTGRAQSPLSDDGERPVRKQLKETSIDPTPQTTSHTSTAPSATENGSSRKRSFEESRDDTEDPNENGDDRRKRSRETTPEVAVKQERVSIDNETYVSLPSYQDSELAAPANMASEKSSLYSTSDKSSLHGVPREFRDTARKLQAISQKLEGMASALMEVTWELEELIHPGIFDGPQFTVPTSAVAEPVPVIGRRPTLTPELEAEVIDLTSESEVEIISISSDNDSVDSHIVEGKNDTNKFLQDPKTRSTDAMNDESPKALTKKRSREQLEDGTSKKSTDVAVKTEDSPEKKRQRDSSQERETNVNKAFAQSAFGSASTNSPFASLGGSKAQENSTNEKPASSSAFASSTLGSFAGSENSPFSALGSSTSSVFKSGTGTSVFGSASGATGFGALGSGFAGVGGGFGAPGKSAGLTNFASPNAPATFGESKPKAIGAEESEEEEESDEEGEETSTFEADKTDERFYEQTIETGEEGEETAFSSKGKLFHFSNGEWKERGSGTFKVNVRDKDTGKQTGRMIMRADGNMRVILNSPIFKGMKCGDIADQEPTTKQLFLASNEEGRTIPLLLRVPNEAVAKDLYAIIRDILSDE
ncbi:hypothetical protein N7462_011311 [Penicillium macrosclerotiorum]|uniref:uncharacterized protein n=1 Tax=Penicillium macrosclerotiorum TaxID=303699 RepID=UPI0025497414|nr:uncharacterized protein N7462_011311 [Penicillium macrosclerotiorum]KAJ5666902.1 hypothetical protein N7462_011311 [Penicillium macrosclerotiorum]